MTYSVVEEAKELRRMWAGFQSSRVLITANNYRIFEHTKSPKTAKEITRTLKTDRRATEIFLDALAGIGLLRKTSGRYGNTVLANRFLISESPYYQGAIIRHADTLWQNWSGLDKVVKTGKPSHAAHDHDSFIRGMHNLAILKARKVVKAFGLKGVKKALDLGGGPGTYAIEMAKKGVSVTLFDSEETIEVAKEIIKKSGTTNIRFLRGDFLHDDIGRGYDLIFISQVLHSLSEEDCVRVIEKSRNALTSTGKIVIQEFPIDDSRVLPAHSALFSINMLVNTEAGRCYSPSEIRQWLSEAGFKRIRDRKLEDTVLVFGEKIP